MRKIYGLFLILFVFAPATADNVRDLQRAYVDRYAEMAVSEMYRSGVPASITLAQGLLESGYGRSGLAVQGNNHFGIKCHDWKGEKVYFDDDAKGECFRKYPSVADSFHDHSDFLRYSDRYKFLFDLETTDYKGWCYGLKRAGYATDPAYPSKLISLIEALELYEWDTAKPVRTSEKASSKASEGEGSAHAVHEKEQLQVDGDWDRKYSPKQSKDEKKAAKQARKAEKKQKKDEQEYEDDAPVSEDEIPQSPLQMERATPLNSADGHFTFSLNRQVLQCNGVPFVYSVEGESYYSIAEHYDLFRKEILRINDVRSNRELLPGTKVYIQAKKSHTSRGLDKHIVGQDGESLWDISQRYGVRLDEINKMNGFQQGHELKEGDTVFLRKQK